MEKFIFNLDFPPYVNTLKIGGYTFKRVHNYIDAFNKLQSNYELISELETNFVAKYGSHQITATVEIPYYESSNVFAWNGENIKLLDDICLLLSCFTERNVFVTEGNNDEMLLMRQDHRLHEWGLGLMASIQLERIWVHKNTGEQKFEEPNDKNHYHESNLNIEKGLNSILHLVLTKEWQEKYQGGHFLFLYQQAIQPQPVDSSFIICWTVWEHIFTLHNRRWLDGNTIEKLSGYEKIAFILSEYFLIKFDNKTKESIKKLAIARNRVIHYGKSTDDITINEMTLFIRLTEHLIAIVLGLKPSNIFNSMEALENFLKSQKIGQLLI